MFINALISPSLAAALALEPDLPPPPSTPLEEAPAAPTPPQDERLTAPSTDEIGEEYEPVAGLDRKTVELKREYEAEVERKVSNDHVHIVLAYGVIWALFVIYGAILWRRHRRLERDLAELIRARGDAR